MLDGMSTMSHRTTFALDEVTAERLRRLAAVWKVSQAEVVRRAVALAEAEQKSARPDPIALLNDLHAQGQGLDREIAAAYLTQIRTDRETWRGQ